MRLDLICLKEWGAYYFHYKDQDKVRAISKVGLWLERDLSEKEKYLLNGCFFSDLYVLEDYRGRGIGEIMLRNAESICLMNSRDTMYLTVDPDGWVCKWYERMGYEFHAPHESGEIWMSKALSNPCETPDFNLSEFHLYCES